MSLLNTIFEFFNYFLCMYIFPNDFFCWIKKSAIVMIGRTFRYGPSEKNERNPPPLILKLGHPIDFQNSLQFNAISGAAKFEHHRIDLEKRGAPYRFTSRDNALYKPIKIGI